MRIKMNYFLIVLVLLLVACSDGRDKSNQSEQTEEQADQAELILAIGGEPDNGFDPTTGWGRYGSPLFQSTLLTYDHNFELNYDLAEDYTVSEDGFVWTVTIRDDVKFADQEPLTADDIVFTFETAKKSGSVVDLNQLKEISALDDTTVEFILEQPDSTFINNLATTGIVPEHAYDENYNEQPLGSGPYQLVQWDKGQQIIVERNPYYYGTEPFFEKLTFLFLAEDAAFAAAKAGEVDVVSVPSTYADQELSGMELVQLNSVDNRGVMLPYVPSGGKTTSGFPVGHDVTSDPAIRKAINLAVDRKQLVDHVLNGFGTPAYSVADQLPWWNPDTVFEDGDLELAKQILDEAGWLENSQGIREKDGMEASFSLLYPIDDQIRQSLSLVFAELIKPLGIIVEPEGESWNEIEQAGYSQPVMMGWGSQTPMEMYRIYSSTTQGMDYYNMNYYSNPVVDDYMERALKATSDVEANQFWQKAQWDGETGFSAQGDAPWVWLVNVDHLYYIHEDLNIGEQKIQPHGHGWPITDFIVNWEWKS